VHRYQFAGNLAFGEKHFENIVPEESLQLFEFQRRRNAKHALFAIKAAIGYEDVAVRIESYAPINGIVRSRICSQKADSNSLKSPNVCMAMTAPGMGSFSGTAS